MSAPQASSADRLPRQEDIDVFGMTHPGKVRSTNADQFLILSLHKVVHVHGSSLPADHLQYGSDEPKGYLFVVADGVGSGRGGEQASETAVFRVAHYAGQCGNLYYGYRPEAAQQFLEVLREAVRRAHSDVREDGERRGPAGMATTLTMVAVFWPMAYLVHVGDSRCYRLRDGELQRLTHDQTMAQALVDAGALTVSKGEMSPLKHVLTSAIGADEASPEVVMDQLRWDDVMLLCSDGLTKHVSDEEIHAELAAHRSAKETVERLVNLALERGGSDNVTVVIGRLREST